MSTLTLASVRTLVNIDITSYKSSLCFLGLRLPSQQRPINWMSNSLPLFSRFENLRIHHAPTLTPSSSVLHILQCLHFSLPLPFMYDGRDRSQGELLLDNPWGYGGWSTWRKKKGGTVVPANVHGHRTHNTGLLPPDSQLPVLCL